MVSLVSAVSFWVVSFRSFRFLVSGFSTCHPEYLSSPTMLRCIPSVYSLNNQYSETNSHQKKTLFPTQGLHFVFSSHVTSLGLSNQSAKTVSQASSG